MRAKTDEERMEQETPEAEAILLAKFVDEDDECSMVIVNTITGEYVESISKGNEESSEGRLIYHQMKYGNHFKLEPYNV